MFRQSKLLFECVFGRSVHSKETENIFHYNKCDNNGGMLTHTVLWVMISRRKICHLDILWKTYDLLFIKIYFRHLMAHWILVSSKPHICFTGFVLHHFHSHIFLECIKEANTFY